MKVQPFSLLSLLLSLGLSAHAQTPSERANARQTFARFRALNQSQKLNTPAARALVVGEAKEYVKGAQLGPMSPPDAFVFPSPTRAVVRVQGLSATGKPITDVYFTLEKVEANWKVSALRSLALAGMIESARDELKSKTMLSPQERDELANMDLTLALDADLRRHFASHRALFERLAVVSRRAPKGAERTKIVRGLHVSENAPVVEVDGSFQFVIGGITDNTVGYGFSPSGALPPISTDEFIWVERLAPHWFLFRTT